MEANCVKPSAAKQADKATRPPEEKPRFTKSALKARAPKTEEKPEEKAPEKPTLRSVKTTDDKSKDKLVTIAQKSKPTEKNTPKTNNIVNDKKVYSSVKDTEVSPKAKVETKTEEKSKMATKPPTPVEKSNSKVTYIPYTL